MLPTANARPLLCSVTKKLTISYFFICFISFLCTNHSLAEENLNNNCVNDSSLLMWAGFAMAGDDADSNKLYPYTSKIFDATKETTESLDAILREKIAERSSIVNRLQSLKCLSNGKLDFSSLAFVLVQETVEKQIINNNINVLLTLQANVFVFNDQSHMVVANFPVRLGLLKSFNAEPTHEDIKAMVREMYTSMDKSGNIFDAWLDVLEKSKVREGKQKYLQVIDVSVLPEASEIISASRIDEKNFRDQTAKILEAAISSKVGIPIVPSTLGAVGGKIKAKFANQSYELKLPDPDYALSFTLRGFVKKQAESEVTIQTGYRVKATIAIKIIEPGGAGRVILDEGVYASDSTTFVKSANIQVNDWNQYFKLMQYLISQLGVQLASPKDVWLMEFATNEKEAKKGFVDANNLLKGL